MERYDIAAKVAPGSTNQQVNLMLQNLLKERFGVALHHDLREFAMDELVLARGGPKLKATTLDPNSPLPPPEGEPKLKTDPNGFPELAAPGLMTLSTPGPNGRIGHMVAKA